MIFKVLEKKHLLLNTCFPTAVGKGKMDCAFWAGWVRRMQTDSNQLTEQLKGLSLYVFHVSLMVVSTPASMFMSPVAT